MTHHHNVLLAMGLCLASALLASCGLYDDAASTAGTVDDAVTLLQDLDDRNVWETASDRLVTLNGQAGYLATVTIQQDLFDESDETVTPLAPRLTLSAQVDGDSDARLVITAGDQTREYLVLGYDPDAKQPRIYRVVDGNYSCATDRDDIVSGDLALLENGLQGVFDIFGVEAVGIRTLAVVEKTDEDGITVAGREAIQYNVVSKVDDALSIVAEFDNQELQAALDEAGQFELSGDLYLDDETLALLRFSSSYVDRATQRRHDFAFEVTQWGDVADLALPTDATLIEACD
jgi:hypothetical protein